MRLVNTCSVIAVLILLNNVPQAKAQELPLEINAGTITYYPPFSFKDPATGKITGFAYDLFEHMAKKVGVTVNWREFHFNDLVSFAPLKTKRVDIYAMGGMTDTPERRESGVSFIDFVYEPYMFFTISKNAKEFEDLQNLCGKPVGWTVTSAFTEVLINKWSEENCVKSGKSPIVLVGAADSPQEKLMLNQGRIAAAVAGVAPLAYGNRMHGEAFVTLGKPLNKNMYGMAFSNENPKLGEVFKSALDELIADGTYVKLLKEWGLPIQESSIGERSSINAGWSLPNK
ncbi:transporter substrate-binding domain-containing protein [Mesorhizobium sp.]|uniref:transporter substrate-binding domain-containing protein n=1 Tax=Mesorhizobium sp. TaxID=1871066 RepID=UPI0025E110A8|nr:transporter substrate-binding domain-containing protein [Mesorhizobium sp.]